MKNNIAVPKEVTALTAQIHDLETKIETARADIERAGEAAREAERIEGELADLSNKRARLKAEALIARGKADTAELDRQEAALEKASRHAREDGKAGALAVQLLEERIVELEAEIASLDEDREAKTVAWLTARREASIDQWMDALNALGPIVAEALAAEAARRRLVPDSRYRDDPFKNVQAIVHGLPMRRGSWRTLSSGDAHWDPAPLDWGHDQEHGKRERDELMAALTDAGVL